MEHAKGLQPHNRKIGRDTSPYYKTPCPDCDLKVKKIKYLIRNISTVSLQTSSNDKKRVQLKTEKSLVTKIKSVENNTIVLTL